MLSQRLYRLLAGSRAVISRRWNWNRRPGWIKCLMGILEHRTSSLSMKVRIMREKEQMKLYKAVLAPIPLPKKKKKRPATVLTANNIGKSSKLFAFLFFIPFFPSLSFAVSRVFFFAHGGTFLMRWSCISWNLPNSRAVPESNSLQR